MSKDPENEKNNLEKEETKDNKPVEPEKETPERAKEPEKENTEKENATDNNDSKPSNAENDSKENSSNKEKEEDNKNPSPDKDKKEDKDGKKEDPTEVKPLSKKELKQIKKERSAQYKLEKKNLQGRRSLSGRGAKNFLIWLTGFLFAFVFLFGGAFIALKIVPLDTYIGEDNGYVDEEISNKSLLDAIMNIGSYNVGQLPILTNLVNEVLVGAGINAYVEVDMERLKQVQFTYPEGSGKSIDVELMNCVKLSPAFVSTLEGVSAFEYVEVEGKVDTTSSDFVPQLYYCQEPTMARTVTYVRAFNDDGTPAVDGLDDLTLYYANLADLYLGDLIEVAMPRFGILPVTELVGTVEGLLGGVDLTIVENVLGKTTLNEIANFDIYSVKVSNLLPCKDENGNSINTEIYGILDGLFVKDNGEKIGKENLVIGDLLETTGAKLNFEGIVLQDLFTTFGITDTSFLETLSNFIIREGKDGEEDTDVEEVSADNLTIGDLTGTTGKFGVKEDMPLLTLLNTLNVTDTSFLDTLSKFIVPNDSNREITDKTLTIGDLTGETATFTVPETMLLIDVLPTKDKEGNPINTKLYEILRSIVQIDVNGDEIIDSTDVVTNDKITIGSLSNIKMGGISLTTVLDNDSDHAKIYSLLKDLTGKEPQNIIVDDLGTINTNNIHLNLVLPYDEHVELYKILRDFCGFDESYDPKEILVSDFDGKNPMNMHLKTVLGDSASDEFKTFLCDLCGFENEEDFENITLNHLKGRDPNNMHLSVLIPDGDHKDELVNILKEATGQDDFNNVTLGSLANFDLSNVHLYTLLPESNENTSDENTSRNHPILKLLAEDETVTIGNMGKKINELRIDQIFEMEVFSKTVNGTAYYLKDGNYYKGTSDGYETYYISKDAKFWLFMLFNAVDGDDVDELVTDANGYADCYVNKNLTFDGLSTGMNNVSSALTDATIRQLVDAGILTDRATFEHVYAKTLNEVLG